MDDIRTHTPGMVWLAPPCTAWCGFSRLNYPPQELRRVRKREMGLVNFTSDVMALQKQQGGIVIVENPRTSDLWRVPVIQRRLASGMMFAQPDLCQFGVRSSDGQLPLKKPMSLLTNNSYVAQSLTSKCPGDHEHRAIQGRETAHSAAYPTAFAAAVFRA